jgi:valyl-tRNA synthetase
MMSPATPSNAQLSQIRSSKYIWQHSTPVKRQRRESEEKNQILTEIQQLEREIAKLRKETEVERSRRTDASLADGNAGAGGDTDEDDDELGDVEMLEALLKEMDDGAL